MKALKKPMKACMAVMFALAMMLVLIPATVAQAAEKTTELSLRSIFSAKYYAENNPDVVAILGDDEEVLYQHFLEFGIPECRNVSPIIDIRAYRNANPDLLERYGDDWLGVLTQFVQEGIYEMAEGTRPSSGVRFNPVTYLNAHPEADLLAKGDLLKVVEMFIADGMPAGIWADESITAPAVEDIAPLKVVDKNMAMSMAPLGSSTSMAFTPVVDEIGSSGTPTTSTTVKQPDPVKPTPTPTCNHVAVFCGNTCNVCNKVIGHDFGESGTDPYCSKCNANYVHVNGCAHENWYGGVCTLCFKVDNYYGSHDKLHVDEECPDCKQLGTVLYDVDKCPGHDYGDGETCVKCGAEKPAVVVPPEDADVPGEDIKQDGEQAMANVVMLCVGEEDADVIDGIDAVVDEDAEGEDVADVEEETVEATEAETEDEPEANAEDADDVSNDAVVAGGSESVNAEIVEFEVGTNEVDEALGVADGAADADTGAEVEAVAEAA